MSICDEIMINDSINAVNNNILKVNLERIDLIAKRLEGEITGVIIDAMSHEKYNYVRFMNTSALEVIMAAEKILKERIKNC